MTGTSIDHQAGRWWYVDENEEVRGPVSDTDVAQLFVDGEVDGLTSVTPDVKLPREEWATIAEVSAIRKAIAAIDDGGVVDEHNHSRNTDTTAADGKTVEEHNLRNIEVEQVSKPDAHNVHNERIVGKAITSQPDMNSAASMEAKRLARKRRRAAKRLEKRASTSVYVTGLPADATLEEVVKHFSKCGIILPSAENGKPRVKLYTTPEGDLKGDALITYAMAPSVENALELLDGVPLSNGGNPLKVERANFDHKRAVDVTTASAPGEGTKRLRKGGGAQALVEDALSWAEEGQETSRAPRIVILKNVFDAATAEYDVIREDMAEGCSVCGEVEKITVFERNAEGVVAVKFVSSEAAKRCIELMDRRWYDRRKISASFFDGTTDYRYKESEEDRQRRDAQWAQWLENEH